MKSFSDDLPNLTPEFQQEIQKQLNMLHLQNQVNFALNVVTVFAIIGMLVFFIL